MKAETRADWRWLDKWGELVLPREMETRHLYYTLRMIWNHSMPVKVGAQFKHYRFSGFYTREYMGEAVLRIGTELAARDDLTPQMIDGLRQMHEYLLNHQQKGLLTCQT